MVERKILKIPIVKNKIPKILNYNTFKVHCNYPVIKKYFTIQNLRDKLFDNEIRKGLNRRVYIEALWLVVKIRSSLDVGYTDKLNRAEVNKWLIAFLIEENLDKLLVVKKYHAEVFTIKDINELEKDSTKQIKNEKPGFNETAGTS